MEYIIILGAVVLILQSTIVKMNRRRKRREIRRRCMEAVEDFERKTRNLTEVEKIRNDYAKKIASC